MLSTALIQNVLGTNLPNVDRAEGVWIFDTDGNSYLDGCSGAMAVNLGHSHPKVVETMRAQAGRVTFTHRGAFSSDALVRLADKLSAITGYAGVWLVNSGSEAVEAALQFAIQYHREVGRDRTRFLSHVHSYHGNTLGALSLSGHARRAGIGRLALDFPLLPSPYGTTSTAMLLDEAERIVAERASDLAAVVFEPVGGATLGAAIPDSAYLRGLREICDRHDVLMIADEVMTGLGRTGRLLASAHHAVVPDLVVLGKGLGAGYAPVAATVVNDKVLTTLTVGSGRSPGGHTYAGNPFSAAVAEAVLDVLIADDLVARSERLGKYLGTLLDELANQSPVVHEARGRGLLRAIELWPSVGRPPGAAAGRLARAALDEGLVIYPATGGFNDACIIAPPLTTTDDEIDELVLRLRRALRRIEAEA